MARKTIELNNLKGSHLLNSLSSRHLQRLGEACRAVVYIGNGEIVIEGKEGAVARAQVALQRLSRDIALGGAADDRLVDAAIRFAKHDPEEFKARNLSGKAARAPHRMSGTEAVQAKTDGQAKYLQALDLYDLTVCSGPAGSGKTYLAVAKALVMLERGQVQRIVISRPAVEAGERLGYLPGDLAAKMDPFLRPIFDAIWDIRGPEGLKRLQDRGELEIAPLAYLRGRTLKHAYCILDEAGNATLSQIYLFLTRLGEGSKMVVTGDPAQIDLPFGKSGFAATLPILKSRWRGCC